MNRTHLERAVEQLAVARGFSFFAVPDHHIASTVNLYPAAILSSLTLHSAEGRRHGVMVYNATLRLLTPGAKLSPKQQNTELATLEQTLLEMMTELSQDQKVVAIESLKIEPAAHSLTPHGELSQSATAQIITWF